MAIYREIIDSSKEINNNWINKKISEPFQIVFPVPQNHSRYKIIQSYPLIITQLSRYHFLDNSLVLIDSGVFSNIKKNNDKCVYSSLEPTEDKTKTIDFLNDFLEQYKNKGFERVIAIGGGIVLNVCSYIAEQLEIDLVLVPTTIIAMSDSSIGGKVRVNDIKHDKFIKHYYKSFYEPSQIIIDPEFLKYLSQEQVRIGLAEIIKHAIYQSSKLADYILSDEFEPFSDRSSLLKAILWTADLKRICVELDPEESKEGSYIILRGAHDISDKIEEESKFKISHSQAILRAMEEDLSNSDKLALLQNIYNKLGISGNLINN